jgi:hypothetical protein
VQKVSAGFDQRNFMGMNASDYGGGTTVVDVWRHDFGLAVGHVETVPKLVALPLTMTEGGARVAVECDQAVTLQPGESFSTFQTFVAVHRGDYFATPTPIGAFAERGMAGEGRGPPMHRSGAPGAMSAATVDVVARCRRRESRLAGLALTTVGRQPSGTGRSTRPSSRAAART